MAFGNIGRVSLHMGLCQIMSSNRFPSLVYSLHFVDNMMSVEAKQKDKLWKLRPWLVAMRDNRLAVPPGEHCSIDEMMVPYYGKRSPIRQFIKGKPHPCGI